MAPSSWRLVVGIVGIAVGMALRGGSWNRHAFILIALGVYEIAIWGCLWIIHRLSVSDHAKKVMVAVVESAMIGILLIVVLGYSPGLLVALLGMSSYRVWLTYSGKVGANGGSSRK